MPSVVFATILTNSTYGTRKLNIEFHYYINFILAAAAGFSRQKAYTIAYASQFVDDNCKEVKIYYKDEVFKPLPTQIYDITHIDSEEIWQTFHFIPGCAKRSNRKDGKTDFRIVVSNSTLARSLMEFSIQQKNYHLLGIASHAYADTWAHQNFIGSFSNLNRLNRNTSYIINNFGHADAFDMPDVVNIVWQDARLKRSVVNNKQRFLQAAGKLFNYYSKFVKEHKQKKYVIGKSKLLELLSNSIGEETHTLLNLWQSTKRIENYQSLSQRLFGYSIPLYNNNYWFNDAIKKKYGKYLALPNFQKSDYYQFCRAANMCRKFMNQSIKGIK